MKNLRLLGLSLFLFCGCVEHLFFIRIFPEGQTEFIIRSTGDSTDIYDSDFLHPMDTQTWITSITKEIRDDDPVWIKESKGFISTEYTSFPGDEHFGVQQYPMEVSKTIGWITTTYSYSQTFSGRGIYTKVPLLGEAIRNNEAADSTQWKTESFNYIIRNGLNTASLDTSLILPYGMEERLLTHFNNYLSRVDYEQLYTELTTNKLNLLHTILAPFSNELPVEFIPKLATAMIPFEHDIFVIMELQDDQFKFAIIMPGRIVETNADTLAGDTLKWSFGLNEFLNDSYTLQAQSIVISTTTFQKIVIFFTLLISLIFFSLWIKKR